MSKSLLAAALLLAASSTALAQPAATPATPTVVPAAAAPQTHGWDGVSHINGQVVKVGESNEYLKTFRRTNISSNPVGWLAGFYGVSASHAVSNNIAVRADVNYIDFVDNDSTQLWEVGVGVPLYLKRTYQGAFIEPGIIARGSRETRDHGGSYDQDGNYHEGPSSVATDLVAGPQMLFGWHLTWDSGFNVAAAAGLGRNLAADEPENEYDYGNDEEIFFNGYFRVGYAF